MRPIGSQTMRFICYSELRRRDRCLGLRGRQFIGKWEEQRFGKQMLGMPCHAEAIGYREDFGLQALPSSLPFILPVY